MKFKVDKDKVYEPSEILIIVYKSLLEKGYNPI
ncbi:MAG: IreB family regulatory phosphoprotein, partial [Firmicutes bacterium]|nr:IreB family regulatory phosphoprotein [Bacillota bacterium]